MWIRHRFNSYFQHLYESLLSFIVKCHGVDKLPADFTAVQNTKVYYVFFQAGYYFCEFWALFMRSGSKFAHDCSGGGGRAVFWVGSRFPSIELLAEGGLGVRTVIYVSGAMCVVCQVNRHLSKYICRCGYDFTQTIKLLSNADRIPTLISDEACSNPVHQSVWWNHFCCPINALNCTKLRG